jgi:hypothetical protein
VGLCEPLLLCYDRVVSWSRFQFLARACIGPDHGTSAASCKQNLGYPVNDFSISEIDVQQQRNMIGSIPANGPSEAAEKACGQGIECGHGGSEDEQPIWYPAQLSTLL